MKNVELLLRLVFFGFLVLKIFSKTLFLWRSSMALICAETVREIIQLVHHRHGRSFRRQLTLDSFTEVL